MAAEEAADRYAAVSSAKTAIRTAKTARRPYSGKSRRSSRYPSPSAIHAVPRIVVLIVTVAVWRVSAIP